LGAFEKISFRFKFFGRAQPSRPDRRIAGSLGKLAIPAGEFAESCLDRLAWSRCAWRLSTQTLLPDQWREEVDVYQRERSIFSAPIVFGSVAFDSFHRDYLTLVWPWRADAIQIKQSVRKTHADKGERNPSRCGPLRRRRRII
jgi:hypothetical protein